MLGLAIFQDSFTPKAIQEDNDHSGAPRKQPMLDVRSASPATWIDTDTQVNNLKDSLDDQGWQIVQIPFGVTSLQCQAYEAFNVFFPGAFQVDFESSILGQEPFSRSARLNEICRWVTVCLGRLVAELRQKRMVLKMESDLFVSPSLSLALEHLRFIPAEHVSLWLMIALHEVTYVLEAFDEVHRSSLAYFFDVTIHTLAKLSPFPRWINEREFESDNEAISSFLGIFRSKTHEYLRNPLPQKNRMLSSLKLIQRFLKLGLDPNAIAKHGCPVPWADEHVHEMRTCTYWQLYLQWLNSFGYHRDDFKDFADVHTEALELAVVFMEYEADANAMIPASVTSNSQIEHMYASSPPKWAPKWYIRFEHSVRQVFEDLCGQMPTAAMLLDRLDANAVKQCKIQEIRVLKDKAPRRFWALDFFNEEQQRDLSRATRILLEDALKGLAISMESKSYRNLHDIVRKTWSANIMHVTEAPAHDGLGEVVSENST